MKSGRTPFLSRQALLFSIVAAAMLLIAGCSGLPGLDGNAKTYFTATVLEVSEDYVLVMPSEDAPERRSADQIIVSAGNTAAAKTAEVIAALRVGDTVKIGYGGNILETYPAQIHDAFSISRVKDEEEGKKAPVIVVSEQNYGFTRMVLEPKTFSWEWKNGGIEADAISPLDPMMKDAPRCQVVDPDVQFPIDTVEESAEDAPEGSAENIAERPAQGVAFAITAGRSIDKITYDRWDSTAFGNTGTAPAESEVSCKGNVIVLLPDSIYSIHVYFPEEDGSGGDAFYYLYTASASEP